MVDGSTTLLSALRWWPANFAREMIKTVVVGKNLGVPQVVHNKNLRYSITLSFEVYCWSDRWGGGRR